jgi:hypothetical protein
MDGRPARLEDIDAVAMRLPQVERSTSGGRHSWAVAGKSFVFSRGPRKDAVDPDTGELMEDVLVFYTVDLGDKDALVEADGPFFTTPHWDGYKGVLLRERDIGRVSRDELAEVVIDAWLARAPKRLAKEFLQELTGEA